MSVGFAPTVRSRLMFMQTAGADDGTDEVGPVRVEPLLHHQLSQEHGCSRRRAQDAQLDTRSSRSTPSARWRCTSLGR
jgi:hypothetical protein